MRFIDDLSNREGNKSHLYRDAFRQKQTRKDIKNRQVIKERMASDAQ